jgi:hypothetical protein
MSRQNLRSFRLLVLVMLAMGGVAGSVSAQAAKPDDKENLQQLLSEVWMLRQTLQALERMNVDTYRTQPRAPWKCTSRRSKL